MIRIMITNPHQLKENLYKYIYIQTQDSGRVYHITHTHIYTHTHTYTHTYTPCYVHSMYGVDIEVLVP